MRELWFWQNIISPHQSALLTALATHPEVKAVHLVVAARMTAEREKLGWTVPEMPGLQIVISPDEAAQRKLVSESAGPHSIHVFSGLSGPAGLQAAFHAARQRGLKTLIMAEPGNTMESTWWRTLLLKLRYRLHTRRYPRSLTALLAIGQLGERWYQEAGFPVKRIYPFGYFVDPEHNDWPGPNPAELMHCPGTSAQPFTILMVGRSVTYKGGEELLDALGGLRGLPWQARFIGEGPRLKDWKALASGLGLEDRVTFEGNQGGARIQQALREADVLVLFNTFKEGWGVVVNEALMVGTPVLCSTLTGAGDLIVNHPAAGEVLKAGDTAALQAALQRRIAAGPQPLGHRQHLAEWARTTFSGSVAAAYLMQILDHLHDPRSPRPTAPWKASRSEPALRSPSSGSRTQQPGAKPS